jgi:hypothetical protein
MSMTPTAAASARSATRRLVAKDDECRTELRRRTLTYLDNQRPEMARLGPPEARYRRQIDEPDAGLVRS